jgi:hypothetical protein
MQILPNSTLGGSLGSSLGTGLQDLAALKLAHLTKQYDIKKEQTDFAQGLAPLLGKDTANFLSSLSPQERNHALQNIGSLMQLNQAPESQLGSLAQPEQPTLGQQKESPERAQLVQDIFTSPKEKREREKLELAKRTATLKETKPYIDTLKNLEKGAKESDLRLKRMKKLIENGKLPNANLWSFLTKVEESPLQGAGAGAAIGAAVGTAVLPGVGTAIGTGIGSAIGGLISPFAGAAKSYLKSGTPDIEEFEKLSADFVKNAKQFFGPRLTNADLQVFMKTLPTLMQTDAGKKKVIENLESLNELAEIEAKAARSIIRANGGIPPLDIEQQVKDKISGRIDKIAKKFITR